ncbi:RES family NAD+ phosphorylase [Maribacter sp. 2210JD10-5]|uniref:RES family NAD+ phosphorylase n=1 Tax=Maribacter sp. 2210JD10-5 TaxID=3386272 RepID=UPI0039BC6BB4
MKAYRLSKEKYKADLSGIGAEKLGGRWNSKGTRMVYASDSRALAKLEVAVNMALNRLPKNYYMTIIEIPDKLIFEYPVQNLVGHDWKNNPPIKFTQTEGNAFVHKNEFLAMKVPSAVVDGDYNYLINPQHPHASKIKILGSEKFSFDLRLFK